MGEYADVILANPPFMSPKGGIKPHNRFSVQSNRSEVLFVDYMAEHLTPNGRAAIIVPEGIIFQSQGAYVQLRKMLVEGYLVAVVSLPAGVFQPYSGVKTSVLILDKSLAKQSQTLGFFRVENDGYGLGAQRRSIEKNDLPHVEAELAAYLSALRNCTPTDEVLTPASTAQIVAKEKIAANGDYNLSGERYRESGARATHYPIVQLGDVAKVVSGQSPPGESYNESGKGVPFYQGKTEFAEMFIGTPTTWTTEPQRFAEAGDILISVRAPVGPVNLATQHMCIGRGLAAIQPSEGRLMSLYAFYFLRSQEAHIKGDAGAVFASINRGDIEKLQIPLPPLEVQKEIVAEIEGYQKVINGARAVLDNYRPHIPIHPDWPMMAIGDVCQIGDGNHSSNYPKASEMVASGVAFIRGTNLIEGRIDPHDMRFISRDKHLLLKKGHLKTADVIFTNRGEIGKVAIVDARFDGSNLNSQLAWLRANDELLPTYLLTVLQSPFVQAKIHAEKNGATLQQFTIKQLNELQIPLPPLATQQTIVAEIEAEQALVTANGN